MNGLGSWEISGNMMQYLPGFSRRNNYHISDNFIRNVYSYNNDGINSKNKSNRHLEINTNNIIIKNEDFHHETNNVSFSNNNNNNRKPRLILLLSSSPRSGSTFFGELLTTFSANDTIYYFEPLHKIKNKPTCIYDADCVSKYLKEISNF